MNLVLRLWVDNGLREREVTDRHLLFGNVGCDFSDASGSIRGFELQLVGALEWSMY